MHSLVILVLVRQSDRVFDEEYITHRQTQARVSVSTVCKELLLRGNVEENAEIINWLAEQDAYTLH